MIGIVSLGRTGRAVAEELHMAWPEGSEVRHASVGNCFQAPDAVDFVVSRYKQAIVVGPVPYTVSTLVSHAGLPRDVDLLCVDPQARWVVPLAGGERAAALALEVQAVVGATPVLDERKPRPADPLDVLASHAVRLHRAGSDATVRAAAAGEPVRLVSDVAYPLPPLPPHISPDAPADAPVLRVTDQEDPDGSDLLVVPRTLVVGIGASDGADAAEAMQLLMAVLKETGYLRNAIARIATVEGKGGHPAVGWAARCLNVPVEEHPAELLAGVGVPNPSEVVGTAVGTPSVAEAAALASSGGGELLVPKRKSAKSTIAIARAAVRGRLATIGLGPGEHDLLVPRALAELRRASAVVGRPEAVEAVASLLWPGTRRIALPEPGSVRNTRGEVLDWPGVATDHAGTVLDPAGAAATLATHGHAVALVALGDGSGLAVPPGPYDLHHVPGLPSV
ncbi:cobalamin biosynthesis protein [Kitasatospora sp. NPDC051170]|uniref:cobalamin biosynthesis protein n=1 Tax=Kitasatospora sp. NPDC051170 TaxID=3364056 RepID=UPI0037B3E3F8